MSQFRTGLAIRVFVGHTSSVRACMVSTDGSLLFSGGKDASVMCYSTSTGERMWSRDGHTDYINRIIVNGTVVRFEQ